MTTATAYWVVVPAAGIGARMRSDRPKQYLPLCDATVIDKTLTRLATHPRICGVVVVVAKQDVHWAKRDIQLPVPIVRIDGGAQRCHSVINGLSYLCDSHSAQQWVLVHDAARPCVRHEDITALIDTVERTHHGAILAAPVCDTMKRADVGHRILQTVERSHLWHAYTPQMFRIAALRAAIETALSQQHIVTDEAGAMEFMGEQPSLVEGGSDNIKITRPEDLALAEFFLRQQEAKR